MQTVTVTLPLELTRDMLNAVREHPTTKMENWEDWYARLGWLICAWDVILEYRPAFGDSVLVPREALEWLMGEKGEFEPSDEGRAQPQGYKRPQFWWRTEFKKRAGL